MNLINVKYTNGTLLINLDRVWSVYYEEATGESKNRLDINLVDAKESITLAGEDADQVWQFFLSRAKKLTTD